MTKRIIIIRHGNTFESTETPTRVGARTDLPLVEKGRAQAAALGMTLLEKGWLPGSIYASPLKRTMETAQIIVSKFPRPVSITVDSNFKEIDYGPDENKTEQDVRIRLGRLSLALHCSDIEAEAAGKLVIEKWDTCGAVPNGWLVCPKDLERIWLSFADKVLTGFSENVLVVTSNGIARFSPVIAGEKTSVAGGIKIAPGAMCCFEYREKWEIALWNYRPSVD